MNTMLFGILLKDGEEGEPFMIHVSCDVCGKKLRAGHDHSFVVKIEVFPMRDPVELTEEDLEEDHLEAVSQMLREAEESLLDDASALEPSGNKFRYDLCPQCRTKFVRDPLSREPAQKFDFSEN
jgi:hypothetical protein